ncbi:MAG: ABC transporter permease [Rhizobiales bacterium]|nr:ABC transporter permease [Hyphomicrobiales bacterium]OJY41113.1 MAG: ABC transporter permease [Rhizobiales bacterium 64-17]
MIALVLALIVAAFLVAPLFIVVPMSFSTAASFAFPPPGYSLGYYQAFFANESWLTSVFNSLIIASITTVCTLAITIPAAMGFVRYRFRGASVFNLIVMAPLITPHIMAALAYYNFLAKFGILGTHLGVIIAHTVLTVPICFLCVCAAIKGFDTNLERAAMSMGAGPLKTFRMVTFPLLRPGFLIGALFTFLYSFEEPVVALFISGRVAATMPKKMFESIQLDADPIIAVVSTLLFAFAALAILIPTTVRLFRDRAA